MSLGADPAIPGAAGAEEDQLAGTAGRIVRRPTTWVGVALLFCCGLTVNGVLAFRLEGLGVFDQYNVLFDTDPVVRLECFTAGRGGMGRSLVHPNLCNLVNVPVYLLTELPHRLGVEFDVPGTRRTLSLLVAPVASGASAAAVFVVGLAMGLAPLSAALVGLFLLGTLSQLIFASLPDHFALGGLAIALALLLAALDRERSPRTLVGWVLVSAFAASVTITNLGLVLAVYGVRELGEGGISWTALRRITAVGVLALLLTFSAKAVVEQVRGRSPGIATTVSGTARWASDWYAESPIRKLATFPAAVGEALSPAPIIRRPQTINPAWDEAEKEAQRSARYQFRFTMSDVPPWRRPARVPQFLMGLLVFAIPAAALLRRRGRLASRKGILALGCLLLLGINGVFHAVWGSDYFVYSQHWSAATATTVALALAPLETGGDPMRSRATPVLLACLVLLLWVNNALQMFWMLGTLRAVGGDG